MIVATSFVQRANFIDTLYIVAFALFIYGMSGLTGPRTAVRGNKIAAVGMLIAVVATLLTKGVLDPLQTCGVNSVAITAMAIPPAAILLPRTAVRGPVRPLIP